MIANGWRRARIWHFLTFLIAAGAVVLQLVLVCQGHDNMSDTVGARPDLATRLVRFASYLTIWGNVLGVITAAALTVAPNRDGRAWQSLRLCAVTLLTVIAIVHWFFLRGLLDLHGADYVADKLLHILVPLLVVVGWLVFGPRRRFKWVDLPGALIIPVGWLGYTLVRGAIVDWYPYPFIDVLKHGYGQVSLACLGVSVLFLALAAGAVWLDSRLPWGATTELGPVPGGAGSGAPQGS